MLLGYRIAVVLPAYNAANTLRQTYAEIPHDIVDDVISPTTTAGTIRRLLRGNWAFTRSNTNSIAATEAIRRPATQLR